MRVFVDDYYFFFAAAAVNFNFFFQIERPDFYFNMFIINYNILMKKFFTHFDLHSFVCCLFTGRQYNSSFVIIINDENENDEQNFRNNHMLTMFKQTTFSLFKFIQLSLLYSLLLGIGRYFFLFFCLFKKKFPHHC